MPPHHAVAGVASSTPFAEHDMIEHLPSLNVSLNMASAILLALGYRAVRRRDLDTHKRFMVAALCTSAAFLTSYLVYHYTTESNPYPFHDWTRPLYFAILIPHIILAAIMVPFILTGVGLALCGRFPTHARLMRWVFPVWMYVSVTGILVYVMLYTQPCVRHCFQ